MNTLSDSKIIFSLPHCQLLAFEKLFQRCSAEESACSGRLRCIENNALSDRINPQPQNAGLFLSEPAVRLKRAYDHWVKTQKNPESFEAFFSHPSQINQLSTSCRQLAIDELGFIGTESQYLQSVLLAQNWLGRRTTRITEQDLNAVDNEHGIDQCDLEKIKALNKEDYALYTRLENKVTEQWERYLANEALSLPEKKDVIIHLGPPKTGTSSIQYWLNKHRDELATYDFYYPGHGQDKNNISSGNFESIIKNANMGRSSYVDPELVSSLITDFLSSDKKVLLLSSEHFFYHLPSLFARFNHAKFIFYIRHPLANLESSYHQQVKRHKRTTKLGGVHAARFNQLAHIKRLIDIFNVHVEFRYFSPELFVGGNIISDFCNAISLPCESSDTNLKINSKYTLEALELMRLCNTFASASTLSHLDLWLQRYSEDKASTSLITKEINEKLKPMMLAHAEQLASTVDTLDNEKLKSLIEGFTPNVSNHTPEEADLATLLKELIQSDVTLAYQLSKEIKALDSTQHHGLQQSLTLSFYTRFKAKLYNRLRRFKR